jgi:hypothetical protein
MCSMRLLIGSINLISGGTCIGINGGCISTTFTIRSGLVSLGV